MNININTRFNVGDEVWGIYVGTFHDIFEIIHERVSNISVKTAGGRLRVRYCIANICYKWVYDTEEKANERLLKIKDHYRRKDEKEKREEKEEIYKEALKTTKNYKLEQQQNE